MVPPVTRKGPVCRPFVVFAAYRDSLAEDHTADAGTNSLLLANPPFIGSLLVVATAKDPQKIVKT